MIKIYNTDQETNEYKEITEYKDGSWINMIDPTEKRNRRSLLKTANSARLYKIFTR